MLTAILAVYKREEGLPLTEATVGSIHELVRKEAGHLKVSEKLARPGTGPSGKAAAGDDSKQGRSPASKQGRSPAKSSDKSKPGENWTPRHFQLWKWMAEVPQTVLVNRWKKSISSNGHCAVCFGPDPHSILEYPLLALANLRRARAPRAPSRNCID